MAINVRTDDITGEVVAWGQSAFSAAAPAGQTDANLASADSIDEALLNTYGPKFCTIVAGRIVAATLASVQSQKATAIQLNTDKLISMGAVYEGVVYMATDRVRTSVLAAYAIGVAGADASAFPVTFMEVDGDRHATFASAVEFDLFYRAMLGTARYWEAIDEALCSAVEAATTVGEVDAVTDTRAWPAPLMFDWDGTFDNDTAFDLYIVSDPYKLHGPFTAGVPAIAVIDGQMWQQLEAGWTNRVDVVSAWTTRGICESTPGQADPTGGTSAYLIEHMGTSGANDIKSGHFVGTFDQPLGIGFFIRRRASSGVFQIIHRSTTTLGQWELDNALLYDTWRWVEADHPAVTVLNPFVNGPTGLGSFLLRDNSDDSDVEIWRPQLPDKSFASSPIPEASTRLKDNMSFLSAKIPTAIKSGTWSVDLVPMHASTDLATSEIKYLYYLDANNFLAIRENGSGEVHAVLATGGGDIVVPIVYGRGGKLSFDMDWIGSQFGGTFGVRGCAAGGLAVGGTVDAWPDAITLFRGSDSTPDNHIDGRLSLPYAGVQAEESILTVLGGGVTGGWDGDNRVMGTPPDIDAWTNWSDPYDGNAVQAVDANKPHLATVNGKSVSRYVPTQQNLVSPAGKVYWPAETTDVTIYVLAQWATGDPSTNRAAISLHEGSGFGGGVMLLCSTNERLEVRMALTSGIKVGNYLHGFGSGVVPMAAYKIQYDGADLTLDRGGVQKASVPQVSTMGTSPDIVQIGVTPASGWWHDGDVRALVVFPGIPTEAQDAAVLSILNRLGGVEP